MSREMKELGEYYVRITVTNMLIRRQTCESDRMIGGRVETLVDIILCNVIAIFLSSTH